MLGDVETMMVGRAIRYSGYSQAAISLAAIETSVDDT